jgi:putative heme iron utilization protein
MGSPAAACRELAARARFGALATVQRSGGEGSGFPFATLVTVAVDEQGRPVLLLSRLAEHTKNLERAPHASLLLLEPSGGADPLAAARMTIVGACAPVPAPERAGARAVFLSAHPSAAKTIDFADFDLWRMEVVRVRWIGGFGRMGWIDAADYGTAAEDGPSDGP